MKLSCQRLITLTVSILAMTAFALPGEAAATTEAANTTVLMHKGISASDLANAKIIKLPVGESLGSLASKLNDDQIIETSNGTRMRVGSVRALQAAFAKAKQHAKTKGPVGFNILPGPKTAGVPIKADETASEILARPASAVVQFPSGRSASVAQLKAMAPYIKQHYGVDLLHPTSSARPNLTGKAILISSVDDLKKIPKDAPAGTILETPKGTRITLGELRTMISNGKSSASTTIPAGESK